MKGLSIIIVIVIAIAAIVVLGGKKIISAIIPKGESDVGTIASGVHGVAGADFSTESTKSIVEGDTQMNKTMGYTKDEGTLPVYSPGTYVAAKDPVYGVPLAFAVVGGVDNTPKTQTLFGAQGGGYGGISAGGGSAGASGYRDSSEKGTWTSAGFQRTN